MRAREETVEECVAKREFGDGEKERVAKVEKYVQGTEKVKSLARRDFSSAEQPTYTCTHEPNLTLAGQY